MGIKKIKRGFHYIASDFKKIMKPIVNTIYSFIQRKRLKNKDFSILCDSCIGGIIYHRLGLQFLSPTVNLWMGDNRSEFIHFVENYKDYCNKELIFLHDIDKGYPRAKLGGEIKIGFTHYHSEEEAVEKWRLRSTRINAKNLFIIIIQEGLTDSEYNRLEMLKRNNIIKDFIVIGQENETKRCDIRLKGWTKSKSIFHDEGFGIRVFEKEFDYVGFLNGEMKKRNINTDR